MRTYLSLVSYREYDYFDYAFPGAKKVPGRELWRMRKEMKPTTPLPVSHSEIMRLVRIEEAYIEQPRVPIPAIIISPKRRSIREMWHNFWSIMCI